MLGFFYFQGCGLGQGCSMRLGGVQCWVPAPIRAHPCVPGGWWCDGRSPPVSCLRGPGKSEALIDLWINGRGFINSLVKGLQPSSRHWSGRAESCLWFEALRRFGLRWVVCRGSWMLSLDHPDCRAPLGKTNTTSVRTNSPARKR